MPLVLIINESYLLAEFNKLISWSNYIGSKWIINERIMSYYHMWLCVPEATFDYNFPMKRIHFVLFFNVPGNQEGYDDIVSVFTAKLYI